jgi:hypothetical protein
VLVGARKQLADSPIIMLAAPLNDGEIQQERAKRVPFRLVQRTQLGLPMTLIPIEGGDHVIKEALVKARTGNSRRRRSPLSQ